ncbi:acetate kinase [Cyphellophora europaea CBS 101466]|uniref:Probable acetate kinase n=1 Tax=Cyphellophora europaea (strain CBS 101466) TaxID=1220924 RepID=W2RIW9_CYPE1|nr:acetate kinase [Cyphellophora europaea CBS 101466]ETN36396.1 acetate kinase [Cyphellophora europaea CBS 101466]
MVQLILSINAGSSSLKCSLYSAEEVGNTNKTPKLDKLAGAEVSAIGTQKAGLKYTKGSQKQQSDLGHVEDHGKAFEHVLDTFLNDSNVAVSAKEDIRYACHRVVQGGDFRDDELITRETFHKIEALSDLAPLHNAAAVQLMKAVHEKLPKCTNVACFDSAFHATMPECVKSYAISPKIAMEKGLRKYGFHGLSYSYVLRETARYLKKPVPETNIIALHLGSGASACAIKNGQSIDTTMGLTPVSGLPGGTRSGDIDPSLVFHYTSDVGKLSPSSTTDLHISKAEEILNKQSGWKALTGTSDFAEIAKADAPDTHKLALDIFVDRIVGYIGSYYVKLGGEVDALVFAGGIGEKSSYLRQLVISKVSCLGFAIEQEQNQNAKDSEIVSRIGSSASSLTLVVQTDEDWQMAYQTALHPKR